jgi:hypothetical protein
MFMIDSASDPSDVPAAFIHTEGPLELRRISSSAITLLNYIEALQEYLEEQLPDAFFDARVSATRALSSIKRLLQSVGNGTPRDAKEFATIMTQSHAAFVKAGLLLPRTPSPLSGPADASHGVDAVSNPWCVPDWCITKLYEGMGTILRDAGEPAIEASISIRHSEGQL